MSALHSTEEDDASRVGRLFDRVLERLRNLSTDEIEVIGVGRELNVTLETGEKLTVRIDERGGITVQPLGYVKTITVDVRLA